MKKLLFAISICVVVFNCNSDSLPDNFESKLFECHAYDFKGYGYEINATIKEFEDFLTEKNLLKNSKPSGYLNLIEELLSQEKINLNHPIPTPIMDKLLLISGATAHCMSDKMEDPEYLNSRYAEMVKVQTDGIAELKKSKSPNMETLRKKRLKFYSKEDLRQPFYKLKFILEIAASDMSKYVQQQKRKN